MFAVIDHEKDCRPVKSGFKTAAQANDWAKKHLPKDDVHLYGKRLTVYKLHRYGVVMTRNK